MIREMIFQSVTQVVRKKNSIRFSTQGAHSGQGAYFPFWETAESSRQNYNIYVKRSNNRNCNSNKSTVNAQLT